MGGPSAPLAPLGGVGGVGVFLVNSAVMCAADSLSFVSLERSRTPNATKAESLVGILNILQSPMVY